MGKTTKSGKSLNPTDAFRKEQRKKELKKNKKTRAIVRENSLVHKDPNKIQEQIGKLATLEDQGKLDKRLKAKKKQLEDTFDAVLKKKQELEKINPNSSLLQSTHRQPTPQTGPPVGIPGTNTLPYFLPPMFPYPVGAMLPGHGIPAESPLPQTEEQPLPPGSEPVLHDIPLPAGPPPDLPLPPTPSAFTIPLPAGPAPGVPPPPPKKAPTSPVTFDDPVSEEPKLSDAHPTSLLPTPPVRAGLVPPPPPPRQAPPPPPRAPPKNPVTTPSSVSPAAPSPSPISPTPTAIPADSPLAVLPTPSLMQQPSPSSIPLPDPPSYMNAYPYSNYPPNFYPPPMYNAIPPQPFHSHYPPQPGHPHPVHVQPVNSQPTQQAQIKASPHIQSQPADDHDDSDDHVHPSEFHVGMIPTSLRVHRLSQVPRPQTKKRKTNGTPTPSTTTTLSTKQSTIAEPNIDDAFTDFMTDMKNLGAM